MMPSARPAFLPEGRGLLCRNQPPRAVFSYMPGTAHRPAAPRRWSDSKMSRRGRLGRMRQRSILMPLAALGAALRYERPRKIRELIEAFSEKLAEFGPAPFARAHGLRGAKEYLHNEKFTVLAPLVAETVAAAVKETVPRLVEA